jgi:hypothetical protein
VTITGRIQTNASTFGVGPCSTPSFHQRHPSEEVNARGYCCESAEGLNIRRLQAKGALLISYGLTSALFGLMHLGNQTRRSSAPSTWSWPVFFGLPYVLTGELADLPGPAPDLELFPGQRLASR